MSSVSELHKIDEKIKKRPTLSLMISIFKSDPNLGAILRYNDFSGIIEITKKAAWDNATSVSYPRLMNDGDSILIKGYLSVGRGIEPTTQLIDETCYIVALEKRYHPIRQYLDSLKWDGIGRVDDWLIKYCGAEDTRLNRYISKMFLAAAVKRVMFPGCQYDHMIILEGPQGINKTRLLEAIGGEFFNNITLVDHDKDTVQKMQGSWIIEVGELAVLKKRDSESLKNFITLKFDDARFAYGRKNARYPRQSIFIGTVNATDAGYLNDHTGNRRFVPVEIKLAKVEEVKKDRDQLFAEALHIVVNGFEIYIPPELDEELAQVHETRETHDEWCDIIRRGLWMDRLDMSDFVTPIGLYEKFINKDVSRYGGIERHRMVNALNKIGAIKVGHRTINGVNGKYYDISKVREEIEKNGALDNEKFFQN